MTKLLLITTFAAFISAFTIMAADASADKISPLYEMRIYYAAEGKLEDLNARFRNHTVKLFEKHGITNLGYWFPVDNKENKLVYVVSFPSKEAREKSFKSFGADPAWQAAHKESEKNGKLVNKIESIFMKETDYSPKVKLDPSGNRIFELRTYATQPGKLPNLHARFRDHTINLFQKHGIQNLWYWEKAPDQKGADNTLIYLLAHNSQDAAKASFDGFRKDEAWIKAKSASEKDGSLTLPAPDGVKSEFLKPTDYSPLK